MAEKQRNYSKCTKKEMILSHKNLGFISKIEALQDVECKIYATNNILDKIK